MSNPTQQTVAAANALSGDKTFKTIQFAITGNRIADCVSGLEAVLADNGCDHQTQSGVLAMLSMVYERHQKILDERQRSISQIPQMGSLGSPFPTQQPQIANVPWLQGIGGIGLGNINSGQLP